MCPGFQMSSSGDETDSEASTSMTPPSLHVGQSKYDFLVLLHGVIRESTVCLLTHDRRQTLAMVDRLAFEIGNLSSDRVGGDLRSPLSKALFRCLTCRSPSLDTSRRPRCSTSPATPTSGSRWCSPVVRLLVPLVPSSSSSLLPPTCTYSPPLEGIVRLADTSGAPSFWCPSPPLQVPP